MVILLEYVKKALLVCTFELLLIIDKHFHKNHRLNETEKKSTSATVVAQIII